MHRQIVNEFLVRQNMNVNRALKQNQNMVIFMLELFSCSPAFC